MKNPDPLEPELLDMRAVAAGQAQLQPWLDAYKIAGGEFAANPSPENAADSASETQLHTLRDEAVLMANKADEIDALATKLQGEDCADDEVVRARQQAETMRATSTEIKLTLDSAPMDPKTGKKTISAKKATALAGVMDHVMTEAQSEERELQVATAEALLHKSKAKVICIKPPKIEVKLGKQPHAAGFALTAGAATGAAAVGATASAGHGWFAGASASVQSMTTTAVGGISHAWQSSTAWAMGGVSKVVGGVTALGEWGDNMVDGAVDKGRELAAAAVTTASNVTHAAMNGGRRLMASASRMRDDAGHAVASAMDSGKTKLAEATAKLMEHMPFRDKHPTHLAQQRAPAKAVAKVAHGPSAMAQAMHQAKELGTKLAAAMPVMAMPDLGDLVPAHLPFSGVTLSHLSPWH